MAVSLRPRTSLKPLYLLAFDHRGSFGRNLLGVHAADPARVADLKRVVFEGFLEAIADGVDSSAAGILVDEQHGTGIARAARGLGVTLAMPVERSGRAEFEFEFGDQFGAHIEEFDPEYAKVLVRYNPEGDAALNRRQRERLERLSHWLRARDRKLLFELLVPPELPQLRRVRGDLPRFDRELRPELVVRTIQEIHAGGIEPDIWKIEGLERRTDSERIAAQARAGGRDHVSCIVLGRGAEDTRVAHWLGQAAPVKGYAGFAAGRTLWWNELTAFIAGDLSRSEAAARIGANYRRTIETYEDSRR